MQTRELALAGEVAGPDRTIVLFLADEEVFRDAFELVPGENGKVEL